MSSRVIAVHTCGSVEKPEITVPWYCLVCLRAPVMAMPCAALGVSTMMRLVAMLLAVIAEAAIRVMRACIPGPISMMLQAVSFLISLYISRLSGRTLKMHAFQGNKKHLVMILVDFYHELVD